jgi:hypothetical protein
VSTARVTLVESELLHAATTGAIRRISAIRNGRQPVYGSPAGGLWDVDIEGCCGELAVAKWFGVYWNGNMEKLRADDAGNLQVRTTAAHSNRLILHPRDPDDRAFVLVTGVAPTYVLQGWIMGRDGKREEFWCDPSRQGRPAFFVPHSALSPVESLRYSVRSYG